MTGNWLTEDTRAWENVLEISAVYEECEREVKEEFENAEAMGELLDDEDEALLMEDLP